MQKRTRADGSEAIVTNAFDEIGRALKAKRITLEEMIKRGRGIRGTLIKRGYDLKAQTTRRKLRAYPLHRK